MVCSFKEQSSDFYRNLEISRTLEPVHDPTQGISTEWQRTASGITGNLALDNYVQGITRHSNCYIREEKICLFKNEQAVSPVSSNTMQSSWLWQSWLHSKHFRSLLWTIPDLIPWTGSSLALGMQ